MEIKREPSTYNSSGIIAKEIEDELMKYTKKDEDEHMGEQTEEVRCNTDVEVDITECTKSLGNEMFTFEYQDTTENSSSFEGTSSGVDNINPLDDSEALSEFCDDAASALDFSAFSEKLRMRRKKPSSHWRSFIQPLMWRCKWVELQMKKLQRDAQHYDQQLEANSKPKRIQLDNTSEDGVKSTPFSQASAKSDILRRKKRKMAEATTDVATYMSHHNLFSYYENKKSTCEAAFVSNEIKNPVNQKVNIDEEFLAKDDYLSNEPGDGDTSLEHLLCKIYHLQSQVGKLKDRVNKVTSENAGMFPCTEDYASIVPCNASTSSNGERMPVGTYIASQLLSKYNMGDARVAESAVMSHGDTPDANGRVEDGDLIDNQRVKDEMNSFAEVKIPLVPKEEVKNPEEETSHSIPSHLKIKEEAGDAATTSVVTEPDLPAVGQSPQKVRSIAKVTAPRGKRKRARRRGSARWSRRSTG